MGKFLGFGFDWVIKDDDEDYVFYSVLGRGGDCYGIAVYEGFEGLNSF